MFTLSDGAVFIEFRVPDNPNEICHRCGELWGLHCGVRCPDEMADVWDSSRVSKDIVDTVARAKLYVAQGLPIPWRDGALRVKRPGVGP